MTDHAEDAPEPNGPSGTRATRSGPLAAFRVLDLGHTVMGPTAGLVLADLGAEVIRVEPAGGDPTRRLPGFGAGFFPFYNRNKGSISLDLKSAEGREVMDRLMALADVLVENFGPGTMERLGLGWEAVHAAHPRLVYLSLKGFLPGPWQDRIALDEVVQMMSGLAYMTGPPGQPLRAGASVIDVLGGVFGALGVLVALRERDETGEGQLVRAALFESAMFLMGQHLAYAAVSGQPVPPMPARISAWAIYDQFRTSDGETAFLGITSDRHWQAFCAEFRRPDLAADAELATNAQRVAARDRLKPVIAGVVAGLTLGELEERAVRARLPFAQVARPEQLFENPHLLHSGGLVPTRVGPGAEAPLPAFPLTLGDWRPGLRQNPPELGQDTRRLLAELGYSRGQVEALLEGGVVTAVGEPERN